MINLKKKLSLLFLIHLFLFDYVKYWSNKNLKMFIIDIKDFNMIKKSFSFIQYLCYLNKYLYEINSK